jgi:hypothetical protein
MVTKKTTTRSSTTSAAKKPSRAKAARPAVEAPARPAPESAGSALATQVAALPAGPQATHALHLGSGFSLLLEYVPSGVMTVARVPAGAVLEVAYWKELQSPSRQPTRVQLHTRVDGANETSLELARLDAHGRLVRQPGVLQLSATAKLLEYWFEIDTASGDTLWDSNWGHNHWLELGSSAEATVAQAEERQRASAN